MIVLVGATAAVALFDLPVETIGDRFGTIRASLPRPHLPRVDVTVAIQGGMVLAAFLFRRRMAEVTNVSIVTRAIPDRLEERAGLLNEIGEDQLYGHLDDALNRARTQLGLPPVPRPPFATPTVRRESGEHATLSPEP